MTNPLLSNKINTDGVILWQYDKAYNLIRLLQHWDQFAKASCEDFWDYFGNYVFAIDSADTYGLNVWGSLLGIPRPTIKIPVESDGNIDEVTVPSSPDSLVPGFDKYGYNTNGYKVQEVSADEQWKTVTIQNELYRHLLKGRFFLMCHTPTVPNYNKYLSIVFGSFKGVGSNAEITYDIFDYDGNIKDGYAARAKVLDFQNMAMGFTFPGDVRTLESCKDTTIEEAYLVFQHYDLVYPFPAGIRYAGEFIHDNLVIGLNTDQEPGTANNQNYKTFVDGMILAETDTQYPNGGIFSTTDSANYKVVPTVAAGKAYIVRTNRSGVRRLTFTTKNENPLSNREEIWIDWGNGDCGYHYMAKEEKIKMFNSRYYDEIDSQYSLYTVLVYFNDVKLNINASELAPYVATYDLCAGGLA